MPAVPVAAPLRAVIVDDEPTARRGVRLLLERERDVTIVVEAGDGEAAISLITRERPDVVFLDVQMPACDGLMESPVSCLVWRRVCTVSGSIST